MCFRQAGCQCTPDSYPCGKNGKAPEGLNVDEVKLELCCCSALSQLNRVIVSGTCISGIFRFPGKEAYRCWVLA